MKTLPQLVLTSFENIAYQSQCDAYITTRSKHIGWVHFTRDFQSVATLKYQFKPNAMDILLTDSTGRKIVLDRVVKFMPELESLYNAIAEYLTSTLSVEARGRLEAIPEEVVARDRARVARASPGWSMDEL